MAETLPEFSIKEVESFCYHLHCIYKGKTKQRSKNLSNPQMRILQYFAKKSIWVMAETFVLICNVSIRERLKIGPIYLKTLEKLFNPQMKILQHSGKNTHMSHGRNDSRL